jgi:arylsulfatase A-like enzyme
MEIQTDKSCVNAEEDSLLSLFRWQKRFWRWVVFTFALAALYGAFQLREQVFKQDEKPNIILISVDTLRADHLSGYGYNRKTSPFLDSFVKKGVRFINAYSQSSWTLPSHMSLFTSTYPRTHGVENDDAALNYSIPTLTEVLQKNGYDTYAFVSWVYLKSRYGFSRGFKEFYELLPPKNLRDPTTHYSVKAGTFSKNVISWAQEKEIRKPFFLFLHLFDPHLSYEPPLEYARQFDPNLKDIEMGSYDYLSKYILGLQKRKPQRISASELAQAIALYDGEIRYVDTELEALFKKLSILGMLDNTMIVFTSDHGEELDDHRSMEGHQWTLYDEVLRIPLTIVFPDLKPQEETVKEIVQSIDTAPTILDVAGIKAPETFEGRSLLPLISNLKKGGPKNWDGFVYSRNRRFNERSSIRTSHYKLIETTGRNPAIFKNPVLIELYDLQKDPKERFNIYKPDSRVARDLISRLHALENEKISNPLRGPGLSVIEKERLRSLGYFQN